LFESVLLQNNPELDKKRKKGMLWVMVGSGYRDMAICWISAGFCPPKLYLSSYESYECPEYENHR